MADTPGTRHSAVARRVATLGQPHERLIWYVALAGGLGLALPGVAARLQGAVPLMLAGQVAGVALTLTVGRLLAVARRPLVPLAALLAQWTLVPVAGIGLSRAAPPGLVRDGVVICGASPAEITSSLVAVLAGGTGELAITLMAGSLALGTVLTPLWVALALGGGGIDQAALVRELALCVALPLAASVALRTSVPAVGRYAPRSLDLAALSVVLVVFVAAGTARDLLGSWWFVGAVGLCAALQAASYATGAVLGEVLHLRRRERRAVLFPLGMREFGIATAVALQVSPPAAAVGGVYGVLVMLSGPAIAHRVQRRRLPPVQIGAAATTGMLEAE